MKTPKSLAAAGLVAVAASFAGAADAQMMGHGNMPGMKMDSVADAAMTDGEVRKIDKENLKITLKHRDIKSLDMPAMTMVFKVKDAAMLDKVLVGNAVRFMAEKADGAFVVTAIEAVK